MYFWRVLNLTQYETKGLWPGKHVLFSSDKFNTVWEVKHVPLNSVKFTTVWDKGFVAAKHFFRRVLNLTQYETKSLWPGKLVVLKSVKFNTVWDKGFLSK